MRIRVVSTAVLAIPLLLVSAASLGAQDGTRATTIAAIDSIAAAPIDAGRAAGMSIAVVHRSDTLVLKGYGYADLEFDVATPTRAVYEIGSVTKQFTAAAVLQLQERDLLSLDDEITKHLPDYPTSGHRITIRRLMDHTSGIKGYTEMPAFSLIAPRKLPRDSLVALFAAEPFDFAPGDAMIYNNSAYFLLGLIIEKASGQTYEEYVQEHLFQRADMVDSRYCSEVAVIKRRANGYQVGPAGLRRADYLDHTWPYSAGSLCSTVGDLVAWNQELHDNGGAIVSPPSYGELITPGTLNDGTRLRYAKGLAVPEISGRARIGHGGGIFGFLSESRYYPDDDLIIVVLINTAGPVSPAGIADAIEEKLLGPPAAPSHRSFSGDLAPFVGRYRGPGRGAELVVTVGQDSTGLTFNRGSGEDQSLSYVGDLTFVRGSARFTFVRVGNKVTQLRLDQVGGLYVLGRAGS